jgi:hypothetical protein
LPRELKELAINRLENVKHRVPEFESVKKNPLLLKITLGQINGVINFIKASDQSHLWNDCIEFNHRLDKTRDQCFEEVNPEFKPYV